MDLVNPVVRRWLQEGEEDPAGFWARAAAQLPWFRRWARPFDWEYPSFRWFAEGRTNLCHNALDHHVARGEGGRVPVIDHWWQTETGGPALGNPYGIAMLPVKPGSAALPLPGVEAAVVNPQDGRRCEPGEKGMLVLTRPFPGLTPSLWGEPERYAADYWQRIPGVYATGDSAHLDEDGYVFFAGRADEVIKCAGHKLGTVEVESALLTHPAVAEAGVVGRPDPLRGEVISAFVALRQGHQPSPELRGELFETVRREIGPVAVMGDVNFVGTLPKTRSGKIMRRVFRAVILDRDPGDITTIEDEGSVDEARRAWSAMREELAAQAPPPA